MKKFAALAALAVIAAVPAIASAEETSQTVRAATDASAPAVALAAGKMLYSANGQRVAAIYRVNAEGNAQVILNGRLVTVPATSLTEVDGKVTTALTKAELSRVR
ncbi:MAG TPA: hypothetical protein VGE05_14075 [Novosphingobium sp.]